MNPLEGKITHPQVVKKDWGEEIWTLNDKEFNLCSKLLNVNADRGFHFHSHLNKKEQFFVFRGAVKYFEIDPETREVCSIILNVGDSIFINPATSHSILALKDSVIIETSTFHEDSDSYRTHLNPEIK